MIPAIGLLVGIVLGLLLQPTVPVWLQPYLPIAVVAALDAVFGAFRSVLDGLFNDRITGEIAYYNKQTSDVLLNVSTQANSGFANAWANVGGIKNSGVEFAIKAKVIDKKFKFILSKRFKS
jgi:small basic protein